MLSYCDKEIQDLLDKKLIRKSKSPWSCLTFYVQKQVELEKGTPRLVINYKLHNDALRWIRYPIPNKITFLVPFGHYEWNIMPFDIKIALLEFQNIMDENFNQLYVFIIVFIIEVLIIETVKSSVKTLLSLALDNLEAFKIVKIDTSNIGYGGILRQSNDNHEILVRHTSGTWSITQHIHSIIKKDILSFVLCISKFQNGLLNLIFFIKS